MKKHGPKRILETKFLYCNKHGECEHVHTGIKLKRWKCCACTNDYASTHRKKMKKKAIEYKGGCCESCGYNKSIVCLTFHHIDPLFKDYNLAGTGICKKWSKLVLELDKCKLLCLNCHLELHEKEDIERIREKFLNPTTYHKKIIHKINARKLGVRPSL